MSDLNSVEDNLSWIFTAFDSDGGGSIDYDEITDICQGLFRLAGIQEDEDMLASCVADVRSGKHHGCENLEWISAAPLPCW